MFKCSCGKTYKGKKWFDKHLCLSKLLTPGLKRVFGEHYSKMVEVRK